MEEEFEQRMYSLVLYQLKPIQQGIQTQHATTEYAEKYFNNPNYRRWAEKDRTTIILSAGGSKQLSVALFQLNENRIAHAPFYEPDLYDAPTAVCFLVDERVWNKEKYPEPDPSLSDLLINLFQSQKLISKWEEDIGGQQNVFLRSFLSNYKLA